MPKSGIPLAENNSTVIDISKYSLYYSPQGFDCGLLAAESYISRLDALLINDKRERSGHGDCEAKQLQVQDPLVARITTFPPLSHSAPSFSPSSALVRFQTSFALLDAATQLFSCLPHRETRSLSHADRFHVITLFSTEFFVAYLLHWTFRASRSLGLPQEAALLVGHATKVSKRSRIW